MRTANFIRNMPVDSILFLFVAKFIILSSSSPGIVEFHPPPGLYDEPVEVALSASGGESIAAIRYTLDGSPVTPDAAVYESPLAFPDSGVLRARAYAADASPVGDEAFGGYLIGIDSPLPIFSLIVDPFDLFDPEQGILPNKDLTGPQWERPAHVTFIPENRATPLCLPAGIRAHGGKGSLHKESLRLYFRSDYGASKFSYPIFPNSTVDRWDRILLRSGSQDSRYQWTLLRNHLMCNLFREQGQPAPAGDFALLFLNGANWGIYNPMEYMDVRFMLYNLGIADGDMVRTDWYATAREGDIQAWLAFCNFFTTTSPAAEAEYALYRERMDIENFTLYWMFQVAAGNEDWPANNMDWVRERTPGAKWQWVMYDADISQAMVQGVANDVLEWSLRDTLRGDLRRDYPEQLWTTQLIRRLLENEGYRKRFVQGFAHQLNTTFAPATLLPRIQAARQRIESSIPIEVEAWKHVFPLHSVSRWQSNITLLETYWTQRAGVLRNQLRDLFALPEPVAVHVIPPAGGRGHISIEGTPLAAETPWTGYYFPGFPLTIQAVPDREHVFAQWTGDSLAGSPAMLTWTPDAPTTLQAVFSEKPIQVSPNDVIFNEYWIEDDRTPYDCIEGRSIEGGWIELLVANPDGVDLRGWRITNNQTLEKNDPEDTEEGSLIFPRHDALAHLPPATLILIVPEITMHNTSQFPRDELDVSAGRIILYAGNGLLDATTDPGFSMRRQDEALVLLHPGPSPDFTTDIGVDFIAEGNRATPASFGVAGHGVVFANSFEGIGGDDGAIFTNDPLGGLKNDNGADPDRTDDQPGPGGWIVDPPAIYTGDADPPELIANILSPGALNIGQTFPTHPINAPRPHPLRESPWNLVAWPPDAAPATYPPNMAFFQTNTRDPGLDETIEDLWMLPYNLDSRSRIVGLGEDGFAFINTSNPQEEGGGYLGAAVLALDTRECGGIEVSWRATTLLPNDREYAVRLRWRHGVEAPFADVVDEEGNPVEYIRHPEPGHSRFLGPISLPREAANRPYIQLKWKYYATGGGTQSGPRAMLGIADIQVQSMQSKISGWFVE